MEPAARYPRSLRRVVAAATTLVVGTAVVAVPEVPGVGLQRAEAQQAIQLQPELSNASVRNNGSTSWEATVFFAKPTEVRSVTFDFVPAPSTGANNSRNDSAADDDPILNVIPEEGAYEVVHLKRDGSQVERYPVVGFKSLGKSPSGRNTIRLTYELPAGTWVGQSDRLVLEAPGKVGVFPTPYLGASRFTNAWVNGGVVAGSVDGLPEDAAVTVSMVNADGKVVRKQDGVRGAYQIPDVQPGNYTMRVSGWEGYSFSPVNGVPVSVEMNAQETANFTFSRDERAVSGVVTQLPAGKTVTVHLEGDDAQTRGVRKSAQVVNGSFSIPGVPTGAYKVVVDEVEGYSFTVPPRVTVGAEGNSPSEVTVEAERLTGGLNVYVPGEVPVDVSVVGPDGFKADFEGVTESFGWRAVGTGVYSVTVTGPEGYTVTERSGLDSVEVKSGETASVSFDAVRDERAVSGRVTNLPAGKTATVRLVGADAQTRGQQFDKAVNGSFAFNDVLTGTYDVKVDDLAGYSFAAPSQVTVGADGNTPAFLDIGATRDTGKLIVYVPQGLALSVRVQGPDGIDATFEDVNESFVWPERPTGVYKVTVTDPNGYSVKLAQGSSNPVEVKKDQTASVKFEADRVKRSVSGRVSNLPAGKTATVRLVGADAQTRGQQFVKAVNGSFAFNDVPTGTYDVKVDNLDGYSFTAPSQVTVGADGNTPASLNVNAVRDVYSFGGSVVNAPAGVDLKVRLSAAGEATREVSVRDGKFAFQNVPTAKYSIQLVGAPQGYSVSGPSSVDVAKDGIDPAELKFSLSEDAGSITGKVVDQNGDPVKGAKATLKTRDGKVVRDLPINTAGEIKVTDVAPGQYTVVVELPEQFDGPASQDIEVRPGGTVALQPVPVVRSTNSFGGSVANAPAGVDMKVRLSAAGEATREVSVRDGKFAFQNVPTAKYSIQLVGAPQGYSVSGPSRVTVSKRGSDPQTPTFELTANPAKVTGTVTDGENKPLPGTVVEFRQADRVVRELAADERGVVRDEAFPSGEYTVVVVPPSGYDKVDPFEVTVKPGEDFKIPSVAVSRSLGAVSGVVNKVPAGAKLRVRLSAADVASREVDVVGEKFSFADVPTGAYRIELLDVPQGYAVAGPSRVTVSKQGSDPQTPTFELTANPAKVTGTVTDGENKPLPGTVIEFKQGDKVVRELAADERGVVRDEAFPSGEYTVVVVPPSGYGELDPFEVRVKPGDTFDLGSLEITPAPVSVAEPDDFAWDNLRVAPGEVQAVAPKREGNRGEEVTFRTGAVSTVGTDGNTIELAPNQNWLEVERDGTVVARPPADTAPGTYRVEVVASTGERDTVHVVVPAPPTMAERYTVATAPVAVPAGAKHRTARPRAAVSANGFVYPDMPLPRGTTFHTDYPGAVVDAFGRVTFTAGVDAAPGEVVVPVTLTYPDGSTGSFEAVFNVGEPLLAAQYPLAYPERTAAPHTQTTAVQVVGTVPEGTKFGLAEDQDFGGWFVSIDESTGRLRAIPPSANAEPLEVKVVAYFPDGSTVALAATLTAAAPTSAAGGENNAITFAGSDAQVGGEATLKPQGRVPAGTRFALGSDFDAPGWHPQVNPRTGEITVRTEDTVRAGEQVLLPVVISRPDGSVHTVEVPVRAVDKQKPETPGAGGSSTHDWLIVLVGALTAVGGLTVALAMNEREVRRVLAQYGITW